jgi:DNA-binding XRE family transcriptional regulator
MKTDGFRWICERPLAKPWYVVIDSPSLPITPGSSEPECWTGQRQAGERLAAVLATQRDAPSGKNARLGRLIQRRRLDAGYISQRDLAYALGIDQSTVSFWERGLSVPRARQRVALAEALGGKPSDYEL